MKTFEIFIDDLTPEAQERFLAFIGVDDAKETNYDVFPLATVDIEEDE